MVDIKDYYAVVDDFCDDVDRVVGSVRAAGLAPWSPNAGDMGGTYYKGMGFVGDHALMLRPIVPIVGSPIVPNLMFFRLANEDTESASIHSDRETGNWTCVVYLSEHDQPSGTAFYRHKPTGLIEMPTVREMKEMGIFEQLRADIASRDPDKWEQIDYVEGKYNRALIFYAPLFHSRFPINGIGKTEDEGRLVWVSHFYKLNGYGQLS